MIAYPAPAKLNLFLQITGRRDDGYHNLQSAFVILDWGDTVYLEKTNDATITRVGESTVPHDDDLTVRAARALQEATGTTHGARIQIDKKTPMGAGMGGGSSDAASTLVGLNQLWETQLSIEQLAELGAKLGADVPVFVHGNHAWAEGVGEILTPIELPQRWYLCVQPQVHANTGKIFSDEFLTRDSKAVKISDFQEGRVHGNAFESVLRRREPAVDQLFTLLTERVAGTPRLTGTGSVVFVEYSDRDSALTALSALPSPSPLIASAWVAGSAIKSPLHAAVDVNYNQFLQGCRQEA